MTVHSYSVVRDLESGGSVGVALTTEGNLYYGRSMVKFLHRADATAFLSMAKRTLDTYQGQLGWRIIEQEVK